MMMMCPGRFVYCTTQVGDVDHVEPMHVQGRRCTENLCTFCPIAPWTWNCPKKYSLQKNWLKYRGKQGTNLWSRTARPLLISTLGRLKMSRSIIPPLVPYEKSKRTSLSAMPCKKKKNSITLNMASYSVETYSEMRAKEVFVCVCVCLLRASVVSNSLWRHRL